MEHYYQNIQGWSSKKELELVYRSMVEKFSSGSHFVEIGSWKGRSAAYMAIEIINSGKEIKLDCIDSWEFLDEIYTTHADLNKMKHSAFDEFKKNIEPISNIVSYLKMNSVEGSKLYEDETLDFVFIDASHEYENVKNDIINWYPKVKIGGIIAGHDYIGGVKKAVDEFFTGKKVEFREISWIYNKEK
jgi:predicted O-methyltransferase YrrM